eukprot:TRINITY_DN33032_c0_g1_i1.p1 TRINITY_DN33032_c0_g1~~TRINITY_DN33032_c0_g1_i1.p1  ORF type:complete len:1099 (+),score=219.46 TRINITY_DN33032_c0_g1_i1:121-3417(+)
MNIDETYVTSRCKTAASSGQVLTITEGTQVTLKRVSSTQVGFEYNGTSYDGEVQANGEMLWKVGLERVEIQTKKGLDIGAEAVDFKHSSSSEYMDLNGTWSCGGECSRIDGEVLTLADGTKVALWRSSTQAFFQLDGVLYQGKLRASGELCWHVGKDSAGVWTKVQADGLESSVEIQQTCRLGSSNFDGVWLGGGEVSRISFPVLTLADGSTATLKRVSSTQLSFEHDGVFYKGQLQGTRDLIWCTGTDEDAGRWTKVGMQEEFAGLQAEEELVVEVTQDTSADLEANDCSADRRLTETGASKNLDENSAYVQGGDGASEQKSIIASYEQELRSLKSELAQEKELSKNAVIREKEFARKATALQWQSAVNSVMRNRQHEDENKAMHRKVVVHRWQAAKNAVLREKAYVRKTVVQRWQSAMIFAKLERVKKQSNAVQRWQSAMNSVKLEKASKKSNAVQSWHAATNAIKLDRVKTKAQRDLDETKSRLSRANVEMARLTEQLWRAADEMQGAEEELQERERLLAALTSEDSKDAGIVEATRWALYLYASPSAILVKHPSSGKFAWQPVNTLNIADEYALLQNALGKSGLQIEADLATPRKLVEVLVSNEPGLCLQISCHGQGDRIYLEDENGQAKAFSTSDLRMCLAEKPRSNTLEVAVLMCCSSRQFGQALLETGFRYVVCTDAAVLDGSAKCFSEAFWNKLSDLGISVETAFYDALALLKASADKNSAEADKILLLTRAHDPEPEPAPTLPVPHTPLSSCSDPSPLMRVRRSSSRKLSIDLDSAAHADASPLVRLRRSGSRKNSFSLEFPSVTCEPEDFVNRRPMPCHVLMNFTNGRRAVCMYGESGMGKTASLASLSGFATSQGRRFSDGVLYDPAWNLWERTSEPLVWKWLEAVWCKLGRLVWEQEATGLQPECPFEVLAQRFCAELLELQTRRRELLASGSDALLLVVDDADTLTSDEMSLLDSILQKTQTCVLLTSKTPWNRCIGTYKVVNMALERLDDESSARLFKRRVGRPFSQWDFAELQLSKEDLALARLQPEKALQQHPLIQEHCAGNPGRIRRAAEQVVENGPSLHELHKLLTQTSGSVTEEDATVR